MATDAYAHELRRKKASAMGHEAGAAWQQRSDSGYSTSSSTSAGSPGATNRSHHHSHTHDSSSSSSKRGRARFSVPEDAKGISKYASLTGFLRKQADNEQGAWNRYYFALRPATYLYYYNSPSDDRPRGIIDLEFLQDIRYNDDCLQRCVGGSEYCFRVSGQMPKSAMKAAAAASNVDKLKLRPMFLDPESPAESKEWMEALKKHRFNVDHAEGFTIMSARIQETERTLKELGAEAQRVATTAESLRWKGRALLNELRGIKAEPSELESRGSFDVDGDIFSTLQELESLVEDFSAEASQQARMIETLRAREMQQTKLIETLRQKENEQEKKIRELAKFGPPGTSSSSGPVESSYNSVISEEELSRMAATKGRTTSNVQELFKKAFLSSKKTTADNGETPTGALESCIEVPEEEGEAPSTKKTGGGFVDAIKIRVANYTGATGPTTTTITQVNTPTSRGSDDTVSISTDDGDGDDKLPPDWTKRESRNHPGDYYYAHTSGFTCWDPPSEFLMMGEATGNGEEPEQQPVVSDVVPEKSAKEPLASLAEVAQAAIEAEAETVAGSEDDKPAKKLKGWGFLKKKLTLGSATPAPAQSPKAEAEPVAVEHEDGRHEF